MDHKKEEPLDGNENTSDKIGNESDDCDSDGWEFETDENQETVLYEGTDVTMLLPAEFATAPLPEPWMPDTTDSFDLDTADGPLFCKPKPIHAINPKMDVYSKTLMKLHKQPVTITVKDDDDICSAIKKLHLAPNSRIIFICHGFKGKMRTKWMHQLKEAMLEERDQTVALVGWWPASGKCILDYPKVAANGLQVGEWIGKYAAAIKQDESSVYVYGVGFSLGAHVMGAAGRSYKGAFNRITGLDPAGPMFELINEDKRLHEDDAEMVDVIHTCGANKIRCLKQVFLPHLIDHFGTLLPLGTIDFYPSYGYHQPGQNPKSALCLGDHHRAHQYYLHSISNPTLLPTNYKLKAAPRYQAPVEDTEEVGITIQMGYHADKYSAAKGLYYVNVDHLKDLKYNKN